MGYKPRPYQSQAVSSVMNSYYRGQKKMLLHLPTGAGKTVIATLIMEKFLEIPSAGRVLFLAHRKEIVDQTAEKIAFHLGSNLVSIEQGRRRSEDTKIVVASVQSLIKRLDSFSPEEYGLIICDECHHIYAKTWTETVSFFQRLSDTALIGMSATPKRTDGRESVDVFGETVFSITLDKLQDLGFLAPIDYYTAEARIDLSRIGLRQGDFQAKGLSEVMNSKEVLELTLKAWWEKGRTKKTIAFCASLAHADSLTQMFQSYDIPAAIISGYSKDRDAILDRFRSGEIRVITNYGVLTEGFDDPSIECVLLARPTTSPLVYHQCLGRGLRTHADKKSCIVIDIIDRSTRQLQYNVFEATGLKRSWKSKSHNPMREATAFSRIRVGDPSGFIKLKQASSLQETHKILMSLPPDAVLAGIDGDQMVRYEASDVKESQEVAAEKIKSVLAQFGSTSSRIQQYQNELYIYLNSQDRGKEKPFLKWHLENATGWKCQIHYGESVEEVSVANYQKLKTRNPKGEMVSLSQKAKVSDLSFDIFGDENGGFITVGSMAFDGKLVSTRQYRCVVKKGSEQAAADELLRVFKERYPDEAETKFGRQSQNSLQELNILRQKGKILDFDFTNLGGSGPPHNRQFTYEGVVVIDESNTVSSGIVAGSSKREAMRFAADRLIAILDEPNPSRRRRRKSLKEEAYFPMAELISRSSENHL